MSTTDQSVPVTLLLPKDVYERAAEAANGERRRLEDLLSILIAEGLDAHVSVRQLLEHVSEQYRAHLAGEGKSHQPPDQVLEELRTQRGQIAHELYP